MIFQSHSLTLTRRIFLSLANRQLNPTINFKDRLSHRYTKDVHKRLYLLHTNGQVKPADVQEDSATKVTDLSL